MFNTRDQRTAGFTLIEVIIVVTVIGLVTAFSAPRLDITRYRVRSGMQGVSSEIMTARRVAITRQHDVVVSFDQLGEAIFIHDDLNNNSATDAGERVRRIPLGDAVVFGLGGATAAPMGTAAINITKTVNGRPAITFHRGGSASEGAGFYLTSSRAAGTAGYAEDSRAIEIERATGRVSWSRFTGSTWKRGF